MRADLHKRKMDKIEFWLDEQDPRQTGWYINSYDDLAHPPTHVVGPFETKTAALRMWHENPEEVNDAGQG